MTLLLILTIVAAVGALLSAALSAAALARASGRGGDDGAALAALSTRIEALPALYREEGRIARQELRELVNALQTAIEARLAGFAQVEGDQLNAMRREATDGRTASAAALKLQMDGLAERLEKAQGETAAALRTALEAVAVQIKDLTEANEKRQEAIRETLNLNLEQLRKDNEAKLEQMRTTVDEKLQGTLETRLGESFKLVSAQLEQVHKGLGEMQTLATGVGDLKRVLTNVKSRGGWGEVQLGAILEDLLTPDQYARNVRIRPESSEIVEYAVRLPGKVEGQPLYLPIDAKFPHEDYDRLLAAQDAGLPEEVERCGQALERAVRIQARIICEKYVHPPHSTDFAIMYLPTEGLFAEIIRRPGLCADIQSTHRVMLTGPTTLSALLTSLQMGFRTLAIEKRSSEVWQVLGAAKTEFRKYGEVWSKLGKQLDSAKKTVDEAGRRTRAVERKLRDVEAVELPMIDDLLLPDLTEDAAADEALVGAED